MEYDGYNMEIDISSIYVRLRAVGGEHASPARQPITMKSEQHAAARLE
jgi:hypothetical protein